MFRDFGSINDREASIKFIKLNGTKFVRFIYVNGSAVRRYLNALLIIALD